MGSSVGRGILLEHLRDIRRSESDIRKSNGHIGATRHLIKTSVGYIRRS